MSNPTALQSFIDDVRALVEKGAGEASIVKGVRESMKRLVARDDWLPEEFTRPHPKHYQQYLLHADPQDRFSVVSFVWGPGQTTPVHDHTVWGVIGILRGAERCEEFREHGGRMVANGDHLLKPGQVDAVSPTIGDVHRVSNALDDCVSISVHAYGANIGKVRRHVFDTETGAVKEFVSGYANA